VHHGQARKKGIKKDAASGQTRSSRSRAISSNKMQKKSGGTGVNVGWTREKEEEAEEAEEEEEEEEEGSARGWGTR
jgi:hypothetical protein